MMLKHLIADGLTLVDEDIAVRFGDTTAYINNYGYVCLYQGKQRKVLLHRLILPDVTGDIDHINRVRTDNRRINLRVATRAQNLANSKLSPKNTTGFKGVCYVEARGKFKASISNGNKSIHLGYFGTPEEAHAMYMRFAKIFFGEFASDGRPPT